MLKPSRLSRAVLLVTLANLTQAFPAFQLRIPNGGRVPHPCFPNTTIWSGVGHWRAEGSGERNPFGIDFAATKFQWTKELCRKDSDGDGMTNGAELGDPDCIWSREVRAPPTSRATTHPGICDPVDAPGCLAANNYLSCGVATTFSLTGMRGTAPAGLGSCPSIVATDLKRKEFRLTGKSEITGTLDGTVPHLCQRFTLPNEEAYHLVAAEPITDRIPAGVGVNHIVVQACIGERDLANLDDFDLNTPKSTCKLREPCSKIAAVWKFDRIAQPNICLPDEVGIRFGRGRFSEIVIDIYYNYTNAWKSVDVQFTGLAIFYTNKLRKYEGGLMLLGENTLEIPPGLNNYRATARLSSQCSGKILHGKNMMNLYYATIHTKKMSQHVALLVQTADATSTVRLIDLQKEQEIQTEELFAEKIGQLPVSATNEIVLSCYYNSRNKNSYTFYDDEMCATAIAFYPADNRTWFYDLTQTGILSQCDTSEILENCPYHYFAKHHTVTIKDLKDRCQSHDYPPSSCLATCKSLLIDRDLVGHSCLNMSVFNKIARSIYSPAFTAFEAASTVANIKKCKEEIYTVALQQAGLYSQLNKTLAEKFGYQFTSKQCNASTNLRTALNRNYLLTFAVIILHEFIVQVYL